MSMSKYIGVISLFLVGFLLLVPYLAFADTYTYYLKVSVFNNSSNTYTGKPMLITLNNTQLVQLGYISTDGLNTNLQEGSTDRTFMVANSRLGLFVPSLTDLQGRVYFYRLGNSPPKTVFPVIVGVNGNFTASNSTSLCLGNNFKVELQGYIDTSDGTNKNIVFKDSAFKIWVSNTNEVSASIYATNWTAYKVTATSVPSGVHFIEVSANSTALKLYVDGALKSTIAQNEISVPVNANGWYFMQNNSVAYLEFLKIWTG